VKFLLDQNQSPRIGDWLAEAGHDAVHVRDVGLGEASDAELMAFAVREDRVVVSEDTDFGDLLAASNAAKPSIVLFRRQDGRRAYDIAALLLLNLEVVEVDLARGAVVVFDQDRVRVRSLPFRP
jgi:predicted nuclease of predicted toxin-antitoxin system